MAEGKSNAEIARQLFLAVDTVKHHITDLLKLTGLENRTQLALWWSREKKP